MENEGIEEEVIDLGNASETENQDTEIQETTKTYSEEEVEAIKTQMKEDNQKAWNKRWGQEKSKLEKQYAEKDELINLLKEQTGKDNLTDLINMSYEQYGVERPSTNSRDEEILGKYDAKEILELDDEFIEDEVNRLAGLKRTAREDATFKELENYLTAKKEEKKIKEEIRTSGIDEGILDNSDFKDFMGKFNKNTPITDIYDLYSQTHETGKKKPFSAGSVKGKQVKEESEYFTLEEFQALTAKDLDNPKIYEKAMKSKEFF